MTTHASQYEAFEAKYTDDEFKKAKKVFSAVPTSFAPATDDQFASKEGAIQFHIIGMQPTDSSWSGIMNENADILLDMGGLVHNYMVTTYPKADSKSLSLQTWKEVIDNIPTLVISRDVYKSYNFRQAGVKISGEFLQLLAKAIITEGASLLTDFQTYLGKMSDITFSVATENQNYKVITCTYLNYLKSNGVGGWYDYSALVLKEVLFKTGFQSLKGVSFKADSIQIDMSYNEVECLVPTRRLRQGGDSHSDWLELVNKNVTAQFSKAKNFFNASKTPQSQIKA